ncbi:MAG TPA: hypothetical protein VFF29_01725 [Bacteroidota bacterium]|nr:hypothetical protein [Bacteroidota bacterium]
MRNLPKVFLVIVVMLSGCNRSSEISGPEPIPSGAYHYTAFDSSGVAVAEGSLTIFYKDSIRCIGNWDIKQIGYPDPGRVGNQIGSGQHVGGIEGKNIWIELYPQYIDNNFELIGKFERNIIQGEWHWITFAGLTGKGTFKLAKN